MSNIFACPECGTCTETQGHLAGKKIRCSNCSTIIQIPEDAAGDVVRPDLLGARPVAGEFQVPESALRDVAWYEEQPAAPHRMTTPSAADVHKAIASERGWISILSACLLVLVAAIFVACGTGGTKTGGTAQESKPGGRHSAEVVRIRLEPFRTATGHDTKRVCVDWKNIGDRPVRALAAKIKAFDAQDNEVFSVASYYIYAVSNAKPGIAPGETYVQPNGEGHILPFVGVKMATRATVEIVKVQENSFD